MIESWAGPTWLLFHALAEKINETFLKNHTSEVLQIIKDICHNLPCPHCRHHAAVYMRSINVSHINSREKIKDMFFTFHNAVNKRLKKKQYLKKDLEKYKYCRFNIIYVNFYKGFIKTYGTMLMAGYLSQNNARFRVTRTLNDWFKKNWHQFW